MFYVIILDTKIKGGKAGLKEYQDEIIADPICCELHVDTAPPPRLFCREMALEKPGNAKFSSMTDMSENSVDRHEKKPIS